MSHITKKVSIVNKLGLHARAAAQFVKVSTQFESDIKVIRGKREVNGKSIMGLLMLAAAKGVEITLLIDGPDATEAMQALVDLVNQGFYE